MPKRYLNKLNIKTYVLITIGLIIYSIGIVGFIMPEKFVTGGAVGIALIIQYATGFPMQYANLAINFIFLTAAFYVLGGKFIVKTIYAVLMLTLFISLCRMFIKEGLVPNEPLMSGVIGGLLMGTGVGITFSAGGSTGGMDIVLAIINKYKNISFGRLMLIFDCIIISSSYFVNHNYKIIISSIIVLIVMTYIIDLVINGYKQSIQLLIFSNEYDKIATAINVELGRGCTVIDGIGWYKKSSVKIVIVVARRQEADDIYQLIHAVDPAAFVTESSVRNVYGQGFNKMRKA